MKPFKTLNDALKVLYTRTSKETFGLKLFKQCMEDLNNPQLQLKCVHVAGTNGKGSVSNYVTSVLIESDFKVGLYTSPFLITHHDRFRINHCSIDSEPLLHYINRSLPYWEPYSLTMFEIDTLIAIWYFIDQHVDWAVFEVGLGGRLDATNVIIPEVSIITTIGYDHMDLLGDTLAEIAYEKAGIIKENVPIVTFNKSKEVFDVIFQVANQRHAPLITTSHIQPLIEDLFEQTFRYDGHIIELSSGASYQRLNAALAFETCQYLSTQYPQITIDSILKGLKQAKWPGRFDAISKDPLIVVDGAHNEEGIIALVENFKRLPKPIIVVFAALVDKPTDKMLALLKDYANHVIVTEFDFYRAQKAKLLAYDESFEVIENYKKALNKAIMMSNKGCVVVCGSLYFISQVYNTIVVESKRG